MEEIEEDLVDGYYTLSNSKHNSSILIYIFYNSSYKSVSIYFNYKQIDLVIKLKLL